MSADKQYRCLISLLTNDFLQTVQMIIISVGEQFSAKSTDVAISCQKIQMLSVSVSDW